MSNIDNFGPLRAGTPEGYERAVILEDGNVRGPRCCGQPMIYNGGCWDGCCDDYVCGTCGYEVRVEWPD